MTLLLLNVFIYFPCRVPLVVQLTWSDTPIFPATPSQHSFGSRGRSDACSFLSLQMNKQLALQSPIHFNKYSKASLKLKYGLVFYTLHRLFHHTSL